MIRKGQQIKFKPEWLEKGEENVLFIATEDECMGRVDVQAHIGLPFNPIQTVRVDMIAEAIDIDAVKKEPTAVERLFRL